MRFSVAHELGHWHHHRRRSAVCLSDDIGNPAKGPLDPERVADGYAADLLMPRYLSRLLQISWAKLPSRRWKICGGSSTPALRRLQFGWYNMEPSQPRSFVMPLTAAGGLSDRAKSPINGFPGMTLMTAAEPSGPI